MNGSRIEEPAEKPRRRASVVDLTVAIWLIALPLVFHGRLLNADGDLARHIMTGRHILAHGPRFVDPFSFTRAGEPFLAYEWLSQVLYAAAHMIAGLPGTVVLSTMLIASALGLVVAYVRRGGDPWLAFMTGIVAAIISAPHWIARPHPFTFLGLAVLINVLGTRHWIWLVPLFAVWSNLHPGFLYGLAMIAIWSLATWIDDLTGHGEANRGWQALIVPFLIAAVASLFNPFGWALHAHALGHFGSDVAKAIEEFRRLNVASPYGITVMTTTFLVVIGAAAHRRWIGWPALLVTGAAFYAALLTIRNAPLMGFFALPLAARSLTPVVGDLPHWAFGRMRLEFARSDARQQLFSITAVVLLLFVVAVGTLAPRLQLLPARFSAETFPEAAVASGRGSLPPGRVLTEYTWGGYVLYAWPGQRLFIDSMVDFYGIDLLNDYGKMSSAENGWEKILAKWKVSIVLFPPDSPIISGLRHRAGWRVVHEDDIAVLLVHDTLLQSGGTLYHPAADLQPTEAVAGM